MRMPKNVVPQKKATQKTDRYIFCIYYFEWELNIMSVDVGEINLATLCIKKINWKDKTLSDNELLTYLPTA